MSTEMPTHSRGAAFYLVLASPGVVKSVCVHDHHCVCENADVCCPLPSRDIPGALSNPLWFQRPARDPHDRSIAEVRAPTVETSSLLMQSWI